MSLYNPKINTLATLERSQEWLKLTSLDGKTSYEFIINPSEMVLESTGEYAKLPVLNTGQPLVKYKSSGDTITFPKVLFATPGNLRDLEKILGDLAAFTRPTAPGLDPVLLSLTWGSTKIPRCFLKTFKRTETQWRSGKPTYAEGSLEFILAPEPSKAQSVPVDAKAAKLSAREQQSNLDKVKAALATNKTLASKLGVKSTDALAVTQDSQVTVTGTNGKKVTLGNLSDILGNKVSPGLKK